MASRRKPKQGKNIPDVGGHLTGSALFKYVLLSAAIFSAGMFFLINQKGEERFSQISLVEETLPERVDAGTRFTFGFEVLNHEGGGMVYEYSVLSDGREVSRKKIALQEGERRRIYEDAVISAEGKRRTEVFLNRDGKPRLSVFFDLDVI